MAISMTGYGSATGVCGLGEIAVEMKAVNSKGLELNVKLSDRLSPMETAITSRLTKKITRGKVNLTVTLRGEAPETAVDLKKAEQYIRLSQALANDLHIENNLTTDTLLRLPDMLIPVTPQPPTEEEQNEVMTIIGEALDIFLASRKREGQALTKDLTEKVKGVQAILPRISEITKKNTESYREKLIAKIRMILKDADFIPDENKILTECVLHADKIAVDEEITRLNTHCDAFLSLIQSDEPTGRRLDFLLQEMNREINTTGSKCCDAEIASIVVDVKTTLEKVREQVQNLE